MSVGLGVRDRYPELRLAGFLETHQPRTFPRGKATWTPTPLLDQYFRAVFVVTGGKGAGHIVRTEQGIAEPVSPNSCVFSCSPSSSPQMFGECVLGVNFFIEDRLECGSLAFWNRQFVKI